MAENNLYEIQVGDGKPDLPDVQTSNEPERALQTDPPPGYTPPQQPFYPAQPQSGPLAHYPPQPQTCQQPYFSPQPQAGQGYAPGYQPFVNAPQTTTSTTVVMSSPPVIVETIRPQNYLVLSILSAIFCCPIFGIIGAVYGCQVDSTYDVGDHIRSRSYSSSAKAWVIAAFVCGILLYVCAISLPLHYANN